MRVASRGQHFKDATRKAKNRHVKGAAAQVVNEERPLRVLIETIRNGGGCGFIQEAQHVQASELRGVFCRLALCVVKICGHGDHRAIKLAAEALFGASFKRTQNFRRHFDRGQGTLARDNLQRTFSIARRRGEVVTRFRVSAQIRDGAAHEALHGGDGVECVAAAMHERLVPDHNRAALGVLHCGRQHRETVTIWQALGNRIANRGNE